MCTLPFLFCFVRVITKEYRYRYRLAAEENIKGSIDSYSPSCNHEELPPKIRTIECNEI